MKKLLLVLIISVFGFGVAYGQNYYVQITDAHRDGKFEPVSGEVFLFENEFSGVNFQMIPHLKYEERIRGSKIGFMKREGYFLFKEGIGMKTSFIYQIGVNILEESEEPELNWVIVDIYISSYTGNMKLKFKGLMQHIGL